jgi:dihydroorotate dehydrogenase
MRSQKSLEIARSLLPAARPIIGVGGIMSAQQGVEKIQAGANAVQIYSGLIYHGPQLVKDLVAAL